ncbi:SatD family protein [Microbacterium aurantiacum]|uniref:SatD family protein n=1 Tax=Microbacterium aurantiacum TaxID=162393 RepID=UPI003F49634A
MPIVLTADIVGSRRLPDRAGAQRAIEDTIARVSAEIPDAVAAPIATTTGDELQGELVSVEAALSFTLLVRLALPEGVDLRFGIGVGDTVRVPSAGGDIAEGSAWWAAREAIDAVDARARRAVPSARTAIAAAPSESPSVHQVIRMASAYLLARDEVVTAMSDRARRLTFGRCVGRTQRELAGEESITQSAVSQALAAAGSASLVEGYRRLRTGW